MGCRMSPSPRKSTRYSANSTREPPSSSTTWTPTVARYRRRTSARRLPDRRRLLGVCRPRGLGMWGGERTAAFARTGRHAAGRARRRQLRPAGTAGPSPESLRGARTQARGQIANENCLTSGSSAPMRECQPLYFQDMSHCSRRRKTMVGRNFLRHFVSRQLYRPLCSIDQTCPSTPVLLSALSLSPML